MEVKMENRRCIQLNSHTLVFCLELRELNEWNPTCSCKQQIIRKSLSPMEFHGAQ